MGAWGDDNFENDASLDILVSLIMSIVESIREAYSDSDKDTLVDRGDHQIVANADILCTLLEQYDVAPEFQLSEAEKWKHDYLTAFQNRLEQMDQPSNNESAYARQEIIERTFDRLLRILRAKLI